MVKQWWQGNKKPVKPWVIEIGRDPCDDSQWAPLCQSGLSEKQGPTHYCPICRWAFWPVKMFPTTEQVNYARLSDPSASMASMTYTKMCNKPKPQNGNTSEYIMMLQLAKLSPDFLSEELKEYWGNKYCEIFPSTELCKCRKARKEYLKELFQRKMM